MHRMGGRTLWLLAIAALSCDGEARATADVRFGVYKVELYENFDGAEDRATPIAEAINRSDVDVLCVQRAWLGHKSKLIERLRARFPYAIVSPTTATTPPTDPRDQNGNIPPAPTAPPCADPKATAALEPAIKCLVDNCARTPGDANSPVKDAQCPQSFCTAELLQLSNSARTCFLCGRIGLEERTIASTRDWCMTDVNAGWGRGGDHGAALFSRLPFSESELHVLPSTWLKSVVLRGAIRLSNGATVDTYCTQLGTAREGGLTDPYAGHYGKGESDIDGWRNEQMLQAERLVTFVRSRNRPAVVLGDFQTSPELPPVTQNRYQATYTFLAQNLTQLDPAPKCTWCPEHGGWWTNDDPPTRTLWIFGSGTAGVKNAGVVFTERTFDFMGMKVAPHWQYGVAATVAVR
jgi:endonuclease/exonuclease/phosphatase family metal-dependent hydrolase